MTDPGHSAPAGWAAERWLVNGRVQRVGFRYYVFRAASRLGLRGDVRNLANGSVEVRVAGQVTFNGAYQMLQAALSGYGLAFLPEEMTQPHVKEGRLRRVMDDCCPDFPGLYAYYPSRRNSSKALRLVIEALKYRA